MSKTPGSLAPPGHPHPGAFTFKLLKMLCSKLNTIHLKSNKSSLGLAQFHTPSPVALCKSNSSYSWNHSSECNTLVNQH